MDSLIGKDEIIYTSCKDCCFAEWDKLKLTQQGCQLNRTERFYDRSKLETVEEDGKQFYEISTVCNAKRPLGWETNYPDPISQVLHDVRIRLNLVIVEDMDGDEKSVHDHIMKSIRCINKQKIIPELVVFAVKNSSFKSYMALRAKIKDKAKFKFILSQVFEREATRGRVVDIAVRNCKHTFYSVFEAGYKIPSDFTAKLDKVLNHDLIPFSSIIPSDSSWNGLTVNTTLHKFLAGNEAHPIWEKIKVLAEQQEDIEATVKNWDDL